MGRGLRLLTAFDNILLIAGAIAFALGVAVYVPNICLPSVRLIRTVGYEGRQWGYLAAIVDWARLWVIVGGRPGLREARLLLELRLLRPPERAAEKDDWWGELRMLLRSDGASEGAIQLETCFDLHDAIERSAVYLAALESIRVRAGLSEQEARRFVSRIEVAQGFLSPLHLLRGLLSRFDEQWQPVIDRYGVLMAGQSRSAADRVIGPVQLSQWNIWLTWGPSIPICSCDMWSAQPAWQYGYGDENNSIPVMAIEDGGWDQFGEQLAQLTTSADEVGTPLIDQATIRGRLVSARHPQVERRLGQAQQSIVQQEQVLLEFGGLSTPGEVLRVKKRRYYSAYLWVLFWMTDEQNRPLLNSGGSWRGLMPFFVHANIAEDTAYGFYCDELARVAIGGMTHLSRSLAGEGGRVVFHYACAADHTNCSDENACLMTQRMGTRVLETLRANRDRIERPDVDIRIPGDKSYDSSLVREIGAVACHMHEKVDEYTSSM